MKRIKTETIINILEVAGAVSAVLSLYLLCVLFFGNFNIVLRIVLFAISTISLFVINTVHNEMQYKQTKEEQRKRRTERMNRYLDAQKGSETK